MPLQPLLPLFHRLNREHFGGALVDGGQPLTAVRWSDGRMSRTAGFYRRGPGVGEGRGSRGCKGTERGGRRSESAPSCRGQSDSALL